MHPRAYRLVFPEPKPKATPSVLRVRPASPSGPGGGRQAALKLEPRELWVAAHVPQLSLLACTPSANGAPRVVLDPEDRHQRIIDADPQAQEAGVRSGMTLGAALAAMPRLDVRARDAGRELALMQRLAAIATTFTPLVSLELPDGLLLEIKPSIRLFGGLRQLCRQLRAACLADPVFAGSAVQPRFTLAPTALAALVAARANARCFITDAAILPARLKPLPLTVLRWPEEENARLLAMGVRTLGELMRLPRAGFAKRFGVRQLADLDRLLGRRADPRRRVARRERFAGRCDLDHEVSDHERILEVLKPLLNELELFLRARQRGITALQCRFHHYRAAPTCCVLRLAAPEANAQRLQKLLRERLATLAFPEPVRRCDLRSGALSARVLASQPLWSPGERGHAPAGEMPALIEHLRARLGADAVYGLCRVSEHRPEHAWRVAEPALSTLKPIADQPCRWSPFRRPLWLLHAPQELDVRASRPQYSGALELLAGPERIESGWWDGADIQHDYYVARDARNAQLWIYRECTKQQRWFLHGVFG
jgi:protein ImuB